MFLTRRRAVLAIGFAAITGLVPPASATEEALRVSSESLSGACAYAGVTTTDGRIVYTFGGAAESYSTSMSRPQATQIICRFISPAQAVPGSEPTHEQTASTALPGSTAATAAMTPSLQLRPVYICVGGFAVYGPIVPAQNPRFLPEVCSSNAIDLPARPQRGGGGADSGHGNEHAGYVFVCADWNTGVACV